jgi:hypothetical protein
MGYAPPGAPPPLVIGQRVRTGVTGLIYNTRFGRELRKSMGEEEEAGVGIRRGFLDGALPGGWTGILVQGVGARASPPQLVEEAIPHLQQMSYGQLHSAKPIGSFAPRLPQSLIGQAGCRVIAGSI